VNEQTLREMTITQHIHNADESKVKLIVTAADTGTAVPRFPRGNMSSKIAAAVRLRFAGWSAKDVQVIARLDGTTMRRINEHIIEHTKTVPCIDCDERPARVARQCTWCWDATQRQEETA